MKRKRLSALLGCILVLAVLAGFVVPLAGRAADYELTVLNPKADFEQINNMPLADRQPLLNKLVNKEPVEILILNYGKNRNPDEIWSIGWTVKEYWADKYGYANPDSIKLVGVWTNASSSNNSAIPAGKNSSRDWEELGIVPPLGTPWGTKSGKNYIDGMPIKEEPFARYREWAKFDAVLIGTAD
ncbi:MAG: hypothetical protein LBH28_00425 [Oscillospiraceae bacterium]|nr:hypothetical protein [Oscillospiraceae bacterium]